MTGIVTPQKNVQFPFTITAQGEYHFIYVILNSKHVYTFFMIVKFLSSHQCDEWMKMACNGG